MEQLLRIGEATREQIYRLCSSEECSGAIFPHLTFCYLSLVFLGTKNEIGRKQCWPFFLA
jgi:hypothetical protein